MTAAAVALATRPLATVTGGARIVEFTVQRKYGEFQFRERYVKNFDFGRCITFQIVL